ncbi:MAG: YvrJ family protein [Bacillus sp. (in: firmicutes)]
MESFIPLISEVGFPIIVTLYFLYRIAAKLDVVVHSIESQPERIKDHKEMSIFRYLITVTFFVTSLQ